MMAGEINTGGPAFPHRMFVGFGFNPDNGRNDAPLYSEQPGAVTLRDYFATNVQSSESLNQAMGEIIAGRHMPSMESEPVEWFAFWFEVEAKLRYMKADAMIKARQGGAS